MPWIDDDPAARAYTRYWFAAAQRRDLRGLASVLAPRRGPLWDVLRLALSRIIIAKERGASLSRDASHSRPHKVQDRNTYDVFEGYVKAVCELVRRLELRSVDGVSQVRQGDARKLTRVSDESVDAVITSPPYLNALDYMRGHRLSLIWLGYRMEELRALRGYLRAFAGAAYQNPKSTCPRHQMMLPRIIRG